MKYFKPCIDTQALDVIENPLEFTKSRNDSGLLYYYELILS